MSVSALRRRREKCAGRRSVRQRDDPDSVRMNDMKCAAVEKLQAAEIGPAAMQVIEVEQEARLG